MLLMKETLILVMCVCVRQIDKWTRSRKREREWRRVQSD